MGEDEGGYCTGSSCIRKLELLQSDDSERYYIRTTIPDKILEFLPNWRDIGNGLIVVESTDMRGKADFVRWVGEL